MINMHRNLGKCISQLTKISPFEEVKKDDLDMIRDVIQNGISEIFSPKTEEEELKIVLQILKEILSDKEE
jgi:hypothetical protein